MTGSEPGHLPECEPQIREALGNPEWEDLDTGEVACAICTLLRACEARVTRSKKRVIQEVEFNYRRGLDAARDAVLALCDCNDRWGPCEMKRMVAAIDALRGES